MKLDCVFYFQEGFRLWEIVLVSKDKSEGDCMQDLPYCWLWGCYPRWPMPYILLSKVFSVWWLLSSKPILNSTMVDVSTYCQFQYQPKPSSPLSLSLSLHKIQWPLGEQKNLCDFFSVVAGSITECNMSACFSKL